MGKLGFYSRQNIACLIPLQVEGVVILEFPSFQEAEDFYISERYQEVIQHRFKRVITQPLLQKVLNKLRNKARQFIFIYKNSGHMSAIFVSGDGYLRKFNVLIFLNIRSMSVDYIRSAF